MHGFTGIPTSDFRLPRITLFRRHPIDKITAQTAGLKKIKKNKASDTERRGENIFP